MSDIDHCILTNDSTNWCFSAECLSSSSITFSICEELVVMVLLLLLLLVVLLFVSMVVVLFYSSCQCLVLLHLNMFRCGSLTHNGTFFDSFWLAMRPSGK